MGKDHVFKKFREISSLNYKCSFLIELKNNFCYCGHSFNYKLRFFMSLIHPHQGPQLNINSDFNLSTHNLSKLLTATSANEVTTDVAQRAFDDYKKSELGLFHHVKKFTASLAAYGLTLGVPVAAVCGATYWLLKDPVKAVMANPGSVISFAYDNQPLLEGSNVVTSAIAPYTTPLAISATLAAIGTVDFAIKKTTGFAPARSVTKWTFAMLSTALLYAAYKAGEITTTSYEQQENQKTKTRERSHRTIVEQLKITYDDVADGFIRSCNAVINDPREMAAHKAMAEQLQNRFPVIKAQLAKLALTNSEIAQIMDKLNGAIKSVKAAAFELRKSSETNDKYNAELLSILTADEFASKAIPRSAQTNISLAKANTLGLMHTAGSFVSSALSGLTTAATVQIAIPATALAVTYFAKPDLLGDVTSCISKQDYSSCQLEAGAVALAALPAITLGASVAKNVHEGFAKERAIADSRQADHKNKAFNELQGIYDGIANHLYQQIEATKNDLQAKDKLKQDAENIVAKLPSIHAQITKTKIFEADVVFGITEQLANALSHIVGY